MAHKPAVTVTPPADAAEEARTPSAASRPGGRRLRIFGDVRRTSLTIIAICVVIYAIYWAQQVLIPLFISLAMSAALSPLVDGLVKLRLPRALATALVLVSLTAVAGYGAYRLTGQAVAAIESLPDAADRFAKLSSRYLRRGGTMDQLQEAAETIEQATTTPETKTPGITRVEVVEPNATFQSLVWTGWRGLAQLGQTAIVVFFLVFFLLSSGNLFRRKLVRLTGPALAEKRITVQMLDAMSVQISRFLLHMAITSVIVGTATWAAFLWLGLEQPALWGVVAGAMNLIPYVGPTVVMIAATAAALVQFGTLPVALAAGGISLVITSIEGFLITPLLISRSASINPVAISLGLAFWGWVWGFWGMLLALPILMVLKTIADHVDGLQGFGELLGTG